MKKSPNPQIPAKMKEQMWRMRQKEIINPPELAPPRGYNHGIVTSGGRLLFLAGQDAGGPDGRIISGGLVEQFEQVLRNLQAVVHAAGGEMADIVKLNIFVASREEYVDNLKSVGQIFHRYFGNYYPAMALFQVSGFFQPEALIEIEGFAVIS
jgi:enamine deaminase RidA (YjgF/YER057c/UK114 family)